MKQAAHKKAVCLFIGYFIIICFAFSNNSSLPALTPAMVGRIT